MGFLIDTCIWVAVERGALAPADVALFAGIEAVYISPVTIAELKFGAENTPDPNIRQKRQAALHRLKRKPVLHIDETTGEIFGSLAAQLKASGLQHRHRVQDLWLASQTIQYGLTLLTYKGKDFIDIPGLSLRVL
ncbi:MAG: type II toxin-antitoxin system VapC family toxin [Deltaproteobacteria bacterium]|nr:type II toxin-antitoxin system VapC family toxin [Deltaproteobacteria bacterium]